MHYYQHHIGDYDRDTAHLTLAQHGAYGKLMRSYYATERPLPADASCLWRICGAMDKAERMAVSFVAEKFFQLEGDVLRHKRIDEEIKAYHDAIETAQRAGRASGEARRKKRTTVERTFERKTNDRSTTVDVPLQRNDERNANGTATNQPPTTNHQALSDESAAPRTHDEPFPTLQEVEQEAERLLVGKDCALKFYNEMDGVGWINSKGHPLRKWKPIFANYATSWKANEFKDKHHGSKSRPPTPQRRDNAVLNLPGRYE